MQQKFSTHDWLLVLSMALFMCEIISCSHIPLNEPQSYHYDPYSYGYDVEDSYGNKQWKQEKSTHPHEVHGSYGYRDKNGIYREVTYVADKNGFRASIKTNEPGAKGSKDPASTNIESYYSPPPPPSQSIPVSTSSYAQSNPSPPIYARQQYVTSSGHY